METGRFSVVVPTYRRPRQLAVCLEALAALDYPRDLYEVIVVDDGSPQPPEGVVRAFRDRLDVTLVSKPHRGPALARNAGAARARGDWLAFTDDDCVPAPEWLRLLGARLTGSPDCAVGGRVVNALPENPCSTASQLVVSWLYAYYNPEPERARFLSSNNFAMGAASFRGIGGFDETYPNAAAEDREICDRLLQRGHRIVYAPEAAVFHAHPLKFVGFCRQHFHYGRGAFCFRSVRGRRCATPIRLEPLSFYTGLLSRPFAEASGGRALSLAALAFVSQAVHAAGFAWEALNADRDVVSRAEQETSHG